MGLPRSGIDSQVEPIPFKQEGFKNSGALAEEIKENTGILVYQEKQFGPPCLDQLHPRLLAFSLHCGPPEQRREYGSGKGKAIKFFMDGVKVNEIPYNRAGLCRQIISPIVPLEKLQEAFVDFCAGKTLKPLGKLNGNTLCRG